MSKIDKLGRRVHGETALRQHLSLTLALGLSMGPLSAAFAEGEALTNNTLPVPQPAPSRLVQKIWGSLDVRKYKKNDSLAANTKEQEKAKSANKKIADASATPSAASTETSSSVNGVTSTGQIIFGSQPELPSSTAPAATNDTAGNVGKTTLSENSGSSTESASSNDKTVAKEAASKEVNTTADTTSAAPKPADTAASATPAADAPMFSSPVGSSTTSGASSGNGGFKLASNLISLPPGAVLSRMQAKADDAVVVDNDEVQEVEETIKQEELPTDEGKTRAKAGARFPVVISSQITSKTAKKGDPIQARLKYDLKIGDRLIAKKGAQVNGHVNYSLQARTIMHSLLSPERWYRNSGCIGLEFDEIINERGEHLPLVAQPSRQARIVKNKAEGRELGVNHYGQVTGPWAQQIRYKAIRIGLNAALAPAGVFTFGAMPVALGVLGAANPSFAFAKPVGLNVRHRRLKGFAWGFLSGVPGSWIIEDTTVKGQEAIVKPGDEFYAELVQEFTGEPASDAQLMPGASTKLHGQLLTDPKKDKKKKTNGTPKQETR